MLDRNHIGRKFGPFFSDVEKSPLMLFAKATGQTDPIFFDEHMARNAGYRSIVAPPTYLMCLIDMHQDKWPTYQIIDPGVQPPLHGSQHFEYKELICAGDRINLVHRVEDIYERKGGILEFIIIETTAKNQNGVEVGRSRSTEIFQHMEK